MRQGGRGQGGRNANGPPEWNEVPDLNMEDEDVRPATEAAVKQKTYEVAQGWRKRRKEDYIRPEKSEHLPTVSQRTRNPEVFYYEYRNEALQEDEFKIFFNIKFNFKNKNGILI